MGCRQTKVIDEYDISKEPLGHCAFGLVFSAVQKASGLRFACKELYVKDVGENGNGPCSVHAPRPTDASKNNSDSETTRDTETSHSCMRKEADPQRVQIELEVMRN